MKTFVVEARVLADDMDGPDGAIVELSDATLKLIEEARKALKDLASVGSKPYCIQYWDSSCTFVNITDEELRSVPRPFEWEPDSDCYDEMRTEANCLVVTDTGIWWEAMEKYSNVPVESTELSWKELGLGE